jgi:hypothetical protein
VAFGSNVSISNYIGNHGDNVNWGERLTKFLKTFKVPVMAPLFQTAVNCVSPDGVCGSAAAGIFTILAGSTSATITTSAVGTHSEIHVDENLSYGPLLGGNTCDSAWRHYRISQQAVGSFVVETDVAPTSGPACGSFSVVN